MKNKQITLCAILLLGIGLTGLQAQTSVNAAGGNAFSSAGSISYSVGQVFYTSNIVVTGSVLQGVQQPYEIFPVGINEIDMNISLSVFPNPTSDYLTLSIDDFDNSNLSYQLYDMSGKLLQSKKLTDMQTQIDMSNYEAAMYYVKVAQGNKEIKTFKVIKR